MSQDKSSYIIKDVMNSIVDKCYEDQYNRLFPDTEPSIEELDALDLLDVGDSLFCSDEFIYMAMDSYLYEAEMGMGSRYRPPRISDIIEHIRQLYEEEIELMEDDGEMEPGTLVSFQFDEESIIGKDIRYRISETLDVFKLAYIQEEYIVYIDPKTNEKNKKKIDKIINSSTINLFDFEFKNIWIDRSNKGYEQSIQEGYNNLLQINLGYL